MLLRRPDQKIDTSELDLSHACFVRVHETNATSLVKLTCEKKEKVLFHIDLAYTFINQIIIIRLSSNNNAKQNSYPSA